MSPRKLARTAFSFLELMFVVLMIGVIAMFVIERVSVSQDAAKLKTCFHHRAQINSALERYGAVNGSFPANLSELETNDYFPEGIPVCSWTGNAYALNLTVHRVEGHTTTINPGDH